LPIAYNLCPMTFFIGNTLKFELVLFIFPPNLKRTNEIRERTQTSHFNKT